MPASEREEQIAFRQYLDLKGLPYFRVPNETYTKSWNQRRLNVVMGVKAGVPDMFVCVNGRFIGIEMKRARPARIAVSAYQKYWQEVLGEHGVPVYITRGADEAIKVVEKYEKAKA